MKILVTGASGQLGQEFKNNISKSEYKFDFADEDELDITNKNHILNYVSDNQIDVIINCAAYTNVDGAETNKKQAIEVNVKGVKNLVEVCEEKKIKMIHFSTDYVYNSKEIIHLSEDSKTDPINYYGFSKREGEKIIEKSSSDSIIIRTSWLYSLYGSNFVKNIIQKWGNENKIYVINDQFGCPTYAKDLVDCVLEMLKSENLFKKKIYNFSNEGYTNWYDFAKKIFELKKINYPIVAVSSNKYKSIATRPKYSITDKSRIKDIFNINIRKWDEALEEFIINYK